MEHFEKKKKLRLYAEFGSLKLPNKCCEVLSVCWAVYVGHKI